MVVCIASIYGSFHAEFNIRSHRQKQLHYFRSYFTKSRVIPHFSAYCRLFYSDEESPFQ